MTIWTRALSSSGVARPAHLSRMSATVASIARRVPPHLVPLPVGKCLAESHEADDVCMAGRMHERGAAGDADEDRQCACRDRSTRALAEVVVLAVEVDLARRPSAAQDLDALAKARLADRRRIERLADRVVLGSGVAGTDAELDAAIGQVIHRRDLTGEVHGVVEVVVITSGQTRSRGVASAADSSGASGAHPSTTWSQEWNRSKPASSARRASSRIAAASPVRNW
jgi:hypothetical protein